MITTFAGTGDDRLLRATAAWRPRRGSARPRGCGGGRAGERLHRRPLQRPRCARSSPAGRSRRSPARGTDRASSGDGGPATSAQLGASRRRGGGRAGQRLHRRHRQPIVCARSNRGGTITTIAGTGVAGLLRGRRPGDRSAACAAPVESRWTRQGNVYIADYGNHRVRKVSPGGTITTFAGGGVGGFSGDGGLATSARLQPPATGWRWTRQGNVYIADGRNQPCAQGERRRDDHDVRRHGGHGLLRGRRPGDRGATVRRGMGLAVDRQGERLLLRSTRTPVCARSRSGGQLLPPSS